MKGKTSVIASEEIDLGEGKTVIVQLHYDSERGVFLLTSTQWTTTYGEGSTTDTAGSPSLQVYTSQTEADRAYDNLIYILTPRG